MTAGPGAALERELETLLRAEGKHALYQMLPPAYPGPRPVATEGMPRLDDRRFEYLRAHLPVSLAGERVVDIGANIGYFSFRLATELGASVVAYEPHAPHAKAMELIRAACRLEPGEFEVRNRGVALADVDEIPPARLVLLLNVLQHAGQDFDAREVPAIGRWREYAVEYLRRLRRRAQTLFFQLGYTWLGSRGKLCADEETIDFTLALVTDAGWRVASCGLIRDPERPVYEDYALDRRGRHAVFLGTPPRGLFARLRLRLDPAREAARRNRYRFAQRPLWILEAGDA